MKKLLLILSLICTYTTVNATSLNTELVINGGAELGNTNGWSSTGIDAVVTAGLSLGFGNFAFTGGTGTLEQTLFQRIDVSDKASQIDSNQIESIFSIQLQSRLSDDARVGVSFLSGTGEVLDSFSFLDVIGIDSIASINWNLFTDNRLITNGTRSIDILLTSSRLAGTSSDGFIDDVSLQLNNISTVPVPAAAWLFGSAVLGFIGLRRRKIIT